MAASQTSRIIIGVRIGHHLGNLDSLCLLAVVLKIATIVVLGAVVQDSAMTISRPGPRRMSQDFDVNNQVLGDRGNRVKKYVTNR